eukprot:2956471-Amphidinium_carterae.1
MARNKIDPACGKLPMKMQKNMPTAAVTKQGNFQQNHETTLCDIIFKQCQLAGDCSLTTRDKVDKRKNGLCSTFPS